MQNNKTKRFEEGSKTIKYYENFHCNNLCVKLPPIELLLKAQASSSSRHEAVKKKYCVVKKKILKNPAATAENHPCFALPIFFLDEKEKLKSRLSD